MVARPDAHEPACGCRSTPMTSFKGGGSGTTPSRRPTSSATNRATSSARRECLTPVGSETHVRPSDTPPTVSGQKGRFVATPHHRVRSAKSNEQGGQSA
jgi:hypothetical protein